MGVVLACLCGLTVAGTAAAFTPTITEFSAGLRSTALPYGIAAGPDGNVWFTDTSETAPAIGVVNPDTLKVTEFSNGLQNGSRPTQITAGPDGNLWFTDNDKAAPAIGEINPSTHTISEFSTGLSPGSFPSSIVAGPDGNLWFTVQGASPAIGEINPSTHTISEFSTGPDPDGWPYSIVAGPDGNLWFAYASGSAGAIGEINPSTHAVSEFSSGLSPDAFPYSIAAGPDGNLWFTIQGPTSAIGEINPSTHAIQEFTSGLGPISAPQSIAAGPDGNLWFTDRGDKSDPHLPPESAIGEVNSSTQAISEFHGAQGPSAGESGIAPGPDGNMWFTDGGRIGWATTAVGTAHTPPVLSRLRVSPKRFVISGRRADGRCVEQTARNHTLPPCTRPVKLSVSFQLNVVAPDGVTITVSRALPGRRSNGRCFAPTHKNGRERRCTRVLALRGTITRSAGAGADSFVWDGWIGGHRLAAGTYQLTASTSFGSPQTVTFRIAD